MLKNAIVRTPGKSVCEGIKTSACLGVPNYRQALSQHESYISALKSCGLSVTVLEALEEFPDSCFVEDVSVLTEKCAVITNPGAASRNKETSLIMPAIKNFYYDIEFIKHPGTLEGGDVMMVGNHFYVGLSNRTNKEGYKQLALILDKYGYTCSAVPVKEVLHLKTGVTYLENNILLVTAGFADYEEFKDFDKITVPPEEGYAVNCICINSSILIPEGFKKTEKLIKNAGYNVVTTDTSEFMKIDGGLTCLSLRF